MLRHLLFALALLAAPVTAFAAEDVAHPKDERWSFEGPFGQFDRAALQRGFMVYKQVCASCHTLQHLSYRNLGEPGGPFMAHGKWNKAEAKWEDIALGPPSHGGRVIPANDNPYVRAIAAEATITEINQTTGQEITRPGQPRDKFVSPYTNPYQAAATHGVEPPDFSVIVKARHNGADYITALLTGYQDPPEGVKPPGGAQNLHYNPYFAGGWISMAPPISNGSVTFDDGSPNTPEAIAQDVVTFLTWASDPKAEQRQSMGLQVLIYLLVLAGLLYAAYKQVWRNESH
jgi:ubiquinol-cytochrome c reductase cytochrome c1 subunit